MTTIVSGVRNPTVTVIVPVFNGAQYLAEALHSILLQDYRPLDVHVVDDGSTDDSAAVAAAFAHVHVHRLAHAGISASLNHGLNNSAGELVAFLDADDRWLPGKLTRQVAALHGDSTIDMVFGRMRQFVASQTPAGAAEVFYEPQAGIHRSTLLIRRAAHQRAGDYSEHPDSHDFLEWYLRAVQTGLRHVMLDDVLADRRIHAQNLGRTGTLVQRQQYLRTLRAAISRQRAAAEPANHGHHAGNSWLSEPGRNATESA